MFNPGRIAFSSRFTFLGSRTPRSAGIKGVGRGMDLNSVEAFQQFSAQDLLWHLGAKPNGGTLATNNGETAWPKVLAREGVFNETFRKLGVKVQLQIDAWDPRTPLEGFMGSGVPTKVVGSYQGGERGPIQLVAMGKAKVGSFCSIQTSKGILTSRIRAIEQNGVVLEDALPTQWEIKADAIARCGDVAAAAVANGRALGLLGQPIFPRFPVGCPYNPKYLQQKLEIAEVLFKSGGDSLQHDDWNLNAGHIIRQGPCFCATCLQKFPLWLKNSYSAEQLAAKGNFDLNQFDYRQVLFKFLRNAEDQGYSQSFVPTAIGLTLLLEEFNRENTARRESRVPLPLFYEFQRYVQLGVREHHQNFRRVLEKKLQRKINISFNLFAPEWRLSRIFVTDLFDGILGEHELHFNGVDQSGKFEKQARLSGLISSCRFADAVNKKAIWQLYTNGIRSAEDWKVQRHRLAMCLAYALGHGSLMPWDVYTGALDSPRYYGDPKDFNNLTRFVRANSKLFEGLQSVATVGVTIPWGDNNSYQGNTSKLAGVLFSANVPFRWILSSKLDKNNNQFPFGRGLLERPVTAQDLKGLRGLVDFAGLTEAGNNAVQDFTGGLVSRRQCTFTATIPETPSDAWIGFTQDYSAQRFDVPEIYGLVSRNAQGLILQVLNFNYNEANDVLSKQQDVGVQLLDRKLWGTPQQVTVYRPEAKPLKLPCRDGGFRIPALGEWAVCVFA